MRGRLRPLGQARGSMCVGAYVLFLIPTAQSFVYVCVWGGGGGAVRGDHMHACIQVQRCVIGLACNKQWQVFSSD